MAGTFRSIERLLETSASIPIQPAGAEVLAAHDQEKPANGDCGPAFAVPADWHEQRLILGDFTRNRPNSVSKTRPRSSWIALRRPQSLHFRRAASASSICSCRIASCNRLSNCFASSRSRPSFAGPNSSGENDAAFSAVARTMELQTYLEYNRATLVDYGRRRRNGKAVSTSRAEGWVNDIANDRMGKKRRMRWSPQGAHRVATVRAAILDGRLSERRLRAA